MTNEDLEEREQRKKDQIRKFESPIPFVIMFRNMVFGKKNPDIYTRITFVINLALWLTFLIWSGFSYFALASRNWITTQKGIPVESIIERRGHELGFDAGVFIWRLELVNLIAIGCWIVFFVGLILLYRKKRIFAYLTLVPLSIYILLNSLFLSITYFIEDITLFDKIALLVMLLSLAVHAYLLKNERTGGSISFFGESQDEGDEGSFE